MKEVTCGIVSGKGFICTVCSYTIPEKTKVFLVENDSSCKEYCENCFNKLNIKTPVETVYKNFVPYV